MNIVVEQIIILYTFILIGWGLGKWKKEQAKNSSLLSFLLVNLFLPIMVFRSFSRDFTVSYITENFLTLLISAGILLLIIGLASLLSPLFSRDKFQRAVYHYSLTITNFSYIGFVLAENLLGSVGLANMILFCIPASLYTYSVGFSTLAGGGSPVKKLINPITVAMVLGMIFGLVGIPMPAVVSTILSSASACVGPLSMLLTGFVLAGFKFRQLLPDWRVLLTCLLRLVLLPALVFFLCKGLALIMPLPDAVYPYAVLFACLPCGSNAVIFPKLIGKDCDSGARIALYSHLISCFTIPIWLGIVL